MANNACIKANIGPGVDGDDDDDDDEWLDGDDEDEDYNCYRIALWVLGGCII